jgi:hypothetical protein
VKFAESDTQRALRKANLSPTPQRKQFENPGPNPNYNTSAPGFALPFHEVIGKGDGTNEGEGEGEHIGILSNFFPSFFPSFFPAVLSV